MEEFKPVHDAIGGEVSVRPLGERRESVVIPFEKVEPVHDAVEVRVTHDEGIPSGLARVLYTANRQPTRTEVGDVGSFGSMEVTRHKKPKKSKAVSGSRTP